MKKIIMLSQLYDAGRELLQDKVEMVEHFCDDPRDAENLLATADGVFLGNQLFGADMIRKFPNLQLIAKQGSGFDNIDAAAATEAGIPIVLSPGANAQAVAEHVMLLVLAANRNLYRYETAVRQGNFGIRSTCSAAELAGKTIGLVGFGRIGKAVAALAEAFGMTVAVYDPWVSREQIEGQSFLYCATLEDLLKTSDTVSIHIPLSSQTRGLIGAEELAMMKKGSILVNCSRGGIVDEKALYDGLISGHIRGAGLDVFQKEPASAENPLFQLDNVVASPHCAALTMESSQIMSRTTAEGILAVLSGKKWKFVANPDVYAN